MARGLQVSRQWNLLTYLAAHRYGATLEELADELGYHARTIRRDVEVLRSLGMPIERDRNTDTREVRIRVADSYRIPLIPFTLAEVMSIYFAGNLLKSLHGTPMKQGFTSALDKIEKTLPMDVIEYADDAQRTLVAKPGPVKDYKAHLSTLDLLREAVSKRRKVEIDYCAYGRPKPDRHVFRPYCLTFADGSIYAIGHSELRDKMRTLLVERIANARLLDATFSRPADFSSEDYLGESFGIWREDATHEVKIEFSREAAQLIREREWHPTQRLEERKNGRVLLTMTVTGLPEVISWVLSFGPHARALSPDELVQHVHGQLLLAGGQYRTPSNPRMTRATAGGVK